MSKTCKFSEDATIFDSDFNETEYKYCTLFGEECKKIKRTKNCPYRLNLKLSKYKHALKEIKGTIKHFKTYFSEKELNKVKFNDITVIEEIIAGAIGE